MPQILGMVLILGLLLFSAAGGVWYGRRAPYPHRGVHLAGLGLAALLAVPVSFALSHGLWHKPHAWQKTSLILACFLTQGLGAEWGARRRAACAPPREQVLS